MERSPTQKSRGRPSKMTTRQTTTSGSGQENPVALNNPLPRSPLSASRSLSLSPLRRSPRNHPEIPVTFHLPRDKNTTRQSASTSQQGRETEILSPRNLRTYVSPQRPNPTEDIQSNLTREHQHPFPREDQLIFPQTSDWRAIIRALRAPLPSLPTFAGHDHEDPQVFLTECENHFKETATEISQWTRLACKALIEPASKWFEIYKSLALPWTKFKEVLLKRFSGTTTLMRLHAQLYSRKQGEKDITAVFLQQKYLLALRLQPTASEEEIVAILLESLRPTIRRAIRASAPRTFTDLFDRAVEAELDEVEEIPKKDTKREDTRPKIVQTTSAPPAGNPVNRPRLPPCNYCPERHFHRDCPVFKTVSRPPRKTGGPRQYPILPRRPQQPTNPKIKYNKYNTPSPYKITGPYRQSGNSGLGRLLCIR